MQKLPLMGIDWAAMKVDWTTIATIDRQSPAVNLPQEIKLERKTYQLEDKTYLMSRYNVGPFEPGPFCTMPYQPGPYEDGGLEFFAYGMDEAYAAPIPDKAIGYVRGALTKALIEDMNAEIDRDFIRDVRMLMSTQSTSTASITKESIYDAMKIMPRVRPPPLFLNADQFDAIRDAWGVEEL